jgi:hypothetical protein
MHIASRLTRILPAARLGWVALCLLLLVGLTLVAVPARFDELQTLRSAEMSQAPQSVVNLRFIASVDLARVPLQLSQAEARVWRAGALGS